MTISIPNPKNRLEASEIQAWNYETMPRIFAIFALNTDNDMKIIRKKGIYFALKVEGKYKGQTEDSYIVTINSKERFNKVIELAKEYNQETILLAYSNERLKLFSALLWNVQNDTPIDKLYLFLKVHKKDALQSEGYTKIFNDYFILQERGNNG